MTNPIPGIALVALSVASSAPAQTYHLRAPSSITEQCDPGGGCTCDTQRNEPLRGRFTLSLLTSDPARDTFSIDSIDLYGATLAQYFTGAGEYIVGNGLPGEQRTTADVAINRMPPVHSDYARRAYLRRTVIDTTISLQNDCTFTVLNITATPFTSDWNADGEVTTADLFDFINSWFAGDGDANDDTVADTQDIFTFLNAWFAGA
jgi:hypothetical protein